MKRYLQLAAVAALALSLASCDALDKLLAVNLFYTPLEVSASDIQGMSLDELARRAESPEFYTLVYGDPDAKAAFEAKITAGLGSSDPATKQQSAILGADMLIYGSGADIIINNVINSMASILESPPTTAGGFQSLIEAIVPPAVLADPDAFKMTINAMVEAAGYYDQLGASIGTGDYAYGGVNAGEIAMNALVAAIVNSVDSSEFPSPGDCFYYLVTDSNPDLPEVESLSISAPNLVNILAVVNLETLAFDFSYIP